MNITRLPRKININITRLLRERNIVYALSDCLYELDDSKFGIPFFKAFKFQSGFVSLDFTYDITYFNLLSRK